MALSRVYTPYQLQQAPFDLFLLQAKR